MRHIRLLLLLLPYLFFSFFIPRADAAQIIGNETITITSSSAQLSDLYLFGESISVAAPVDNDIVTAGGRIDLSGSTTGSVLAAGGTLTIDTAIGNTLRAAGGNITISGPISRDAVIAGGQIVFDENAQITGDILVAGGSVIISSPVRGKVIANAGEVVINSTIGGNVEGNIGKLRLTERARINGDLKYRSEQRADVANGAVVRGEHIFTQDQTAKQAKQGVQSAFSRGTIYKLIADILISLLLIYFFKKLLNDMFITGIQSPLKLTGIGFALLVLMPLVSILLLILFLLGFVSLILYLFILLVSIMLGKVLLGWLIMRLWEKRQGRAYVLDYKAGFIGPLFMYVLFLIPILGWLAAFLLYLFTIGIVAITLLPLATEQRHNAQPVKKKRK
jgi:hypothetical protein